MQADESLLTSIKSKDSFTSTHDWPQLFFTTKEPDQALPIYTEAPIEFPPAYQFFVPSIVLKVKWTVRRWKRRLLYAMFAVGVVIASVADYFARGATLEWPTLVVAIAGGIAAFFMTFALFKIKK